MNVDLIETEPDRAFEWAVAAISADRKRIFEALEKLAVDGKINQTIADIKRIVENR